jgi:cytochrome c oxidase subunit 2
MRADLPLFPDQASTIARGVDNLYFFQVAVTLIMTVLIFSAIFYFAIRYRRRRADEIPKPIEGSLALEIFWSAVPFVVAMVMFGWGTALYFQDASPPPGAMDIYVVGKQWMWKLQHPEGRREINELHVPVNRPVRLTMATEDVIHSFYIPAFRVKKDVVPGRYSSIWFEATKTGKYHLFCAEYCGTNHSGMIGWVYVMEPVEYENWLSGGTAGQSMASAGGALFQSLGCANCHSPGGRGPVLNGVYGSPVKLESGQTVTADDAYIRESILHPDARIVGGYPAVMPTFQGQISEEGLLQILAYIRSLGRPQLEGVPPAAAPKPQPRSEAR